MTQNPQRIVRPDTAFALSGKAKRPRVTAEGHLKWIRTLPCLVSGKRDHVEAAHVRYADHRFGKRETGGQEKPDDKWTVPLHADLHWRGKDAQHKSSEFEWWKARGIDPVAIASALWGVSGDDEAAEVILRNAKAQS